MTKYKNLSGISGVASYEIGDKHIKVEFKYGAIYLYDYLNPGQAAVDRMKMLAAEGRGLNTFINTDVRKNYAQKLN